MSGTSRKKLDYEKCEIGCKSLNFGKKNLPEVVESIWKVCRHIRHKWVG